MQNPIVKNVGAHRWQLVTSYMSPSGEVIVPANFVFDGASVPRIFWTFASPGGAFFKASIAHDYHYERGIGTKARADERFYRELRLTGVGKVRATLAYWAVCLGGRGSF